MNLKDYYKQKLSESNDAPKSFTDEVISAVRKHVKDPERTVSSERGDDFDMFDHARSVANAIEWHIRNPDKVQAWEKDKHAKRIDWLKRTLPPEVVSSLMSRHFGESK